MLSSSKIAEWRQSVHCIVSTQQAQNFESVLRRKKKRCRNDCKSLSTCLAEHYNQRKKEKLKR